MVAIEGGRAYLTDQRFFDRRSPARSGSFFIPLDNR
jgi:hypothetical protein